MNEINKTVCSLSEFIKLMDKSNNNIYYYRGENQNYFSINASSFRNIEKTAWKATYFDYKKMLNDYYKEVSSTLSGLEQENFMPFAQHHGLPTPLVDMTNNSLTALYFAVQPSKMNEGYVYLFNQEKSIDISSLIINNWDRDILFDFVINDEEIWELFFLEIELIKRDYPSYFYELFFDLIFWCT